MLSLSSHHSQEEQDTCQAVSSAGPPQDILVNVDATGKLHLSRTNSRFETAKSIITKGSASPTSTTTNVPSAVPSASASGSSSSLSKASASSSSKSAKGAGSRAAKVRKSASASPTRAEVDSSDEGEEIPDGNYHSYKDDYGKPVSISKADLDRRINSLKLWQSHLNVLRYHEDRKHAALRGITWSGGTVKRSEAQKSLEDELLKGIRDKLKDLVNASPLSPDESALLTELADIRRDTDKQPGGWSIKMRTDGLLRAKSETEYRSKRWNKREAFLKSSYYIPDVQNKPLGAAARAALEPLEDEVSVCVPCELAGASGFD